MRQFIIFIIILVFKLALYSQTDSLFLRLPEYIYTTNTSRFSLYYNNTLLTQNPENYSFVVNCSVGYPDSMKYNLDSLTTGNYNLTLEVRDSLGSVLESKSTELIVIDNSTSFSDTLKILFVGNSLTLGGKYQRFTKQFLEESGNTVKLLGTQFYTEQDSIDGIFHEGRGGWTWRKFCRDTISPFVFGNYPGVDIQRYIDESLNGEKPDIITLFLGINDIDFIETSSLEEIDSGIDIIFNEWNMGHLIDEFENSLPNTPIGIVLIPVANERIYPWYIATGDSLRGWKWKLKQHRLVQRYIDHYNDMGKPNFSMIPVYPNIDTYLGYPEDNAQHPNLFGYEQIANTFYGWIKYQIYQWMSEPRNLNITYNLDYVCIDWLSVNGATSYRIFRSVDPNSDSEFVEIGTSTVPNYTDFDVTGSDKYFYKVTAVN